MYFFFTENKEALIKMLKDLESICKGKDKKNKQDISTKRQNNNTKKKCKAFKKKNKPGRGNLRQKKKEDCDTR